MTDRSIVLPCPACLQKNRLPLARIGDRPICSRCRVPLVSGHPIELDDASFDAYVGASDLPVVVDFWASWCGPCRAMAPQFAIAAQQMTGRAIFAKLDTEQSQQVAARFEVRSIPLVVVLRGGREVMRHVGFMTADELVGWLSAHGV